VVGDGVVLVVVDVVVVVVLVVVVEVVVDVVVLVVLVGEEVVEVGISHFTVSIIISEALVFGILSVAVLKTSPDSVRLTPVMTVMVVWCVSVVLHGDSLHVV